VKRSHGRQRPCAPLRAGADESNQATLIARRNTPGASDPLALGEREREVVRYVALGHTTKETAYALGVEAATVTSHLIAAMRKLGVSTRVELLGLLSRMAIELDRVASTK
jgi:DNA-binding NarL/FixJ family response regulator